MKVPTVLYDLGVAKQSEACPTDFQSCFHTIQDRYRDHQRQIQKPDTASVYVAELQFTLKEKSSLYMWTLGLAYKQLRVYT